MKSAVKSSKVNRAWLNDHVNDTYVKLAQKDGYRARAAYKLKEIDETLHLIEPGQLVVDLGPTPGGLESVCASRKLSPRTATGGGAAAGALNGSIIALDLLPMEPIEGVVFIQGDIREESVLAQLAAQMQEQLADTVISDMAPNLSGIESVDAARIEHLVELALEFSQHHLKPQGALIAKVFHGSSYDTVAKRFRDVFVTVKRIKPKASRDKSSETFFGWSDVLK
jgi:23S rRNA (uridine2552-2'-O)-methyltransferase